MAINLVKNTINGVNLIKIRHFWGKWPKFAHFGGQNDVIGQPLGEIRQQILSLKVSTGWPLYFLPQIPGFPGHFQDIFSPFTGHFCLFFSPKIEKVIKSKKHFSG